MNQRHEIRDRILDEALERFFQFGYTAVTMDEIASELRMSKKTLYELFPAKKDLLRQALERRAGRIAEGLKTIVEAEETDYPRKLERVMRFVAENLPRPSQRFFRDVAHKVPDVWKPVHAKRAEVIRTQFGRLFSEGIQVGAFRKDIDPQFLILVFTALVQDVINPETLSNLPLSAAQAFEKLSSILLLGVLTETGRGHYRKEAVK